MAMLFAYKRDMQRLWVDRFASIEIPALEEREGILRRLVEWEATMMMPRPTSQGRLQEWIRRKKALHLSDPPFKKPPKASPNP